MNFRHIVLVGLIIFILMAPVCASENVADFNNSTKITFEGIEFLIPVEDISKANVLFDQLMGTSPTPRKKYIEEHSDEAEVEF